MRSLFLLLACLYPRRRRLRSRAPLPAASRWSIGQASGGPRRNCSPAPGRSAARGGRRRAGPAREHRPRARLPRADLSARSGQIGSWWDPQHSYSGQAGNLTLELKAGGCFCERLPNGGGIEHLRVVYVEPGKRIVLTGALGPLLFDAVHGVIDVQIRPSAAGSDLVLTYK